jgi:hypothetical protein
MTLLGKSFALRRETFSIVTNSGELKKSNFPRNTGFKLCVGALAICCKCNKGKIRIGIKPLIADNHLLTSSLKIERRHTFYRMLCC